jgi:uncharacterized membrane protein (UPF0127 family)
MIKYSFPWAFNQPEKSLDSLPGIQPSFAPAQEEAPRGDSTATSTLEHLRTLNDEEDREIVNLLEDPLSPNEEIYDSFEFEASNFDEEKLKTAFLNLRRNLSPICFGVLKNANPGAEFVLEKEGFVAKRNGNDVFAKRANLEKVAVVKIYNQNDDKAKFVCDKAISTEDKIRGLQGYKSLTSSSGMLFSYAYPQNVLYHMGSVRFPIDILFVDSQNKIKRAYKNIAPGTLGTFGCSDVLNVIEISGGLSDKIGLQIGDKVSVEKLSSEEQDIFLKKSFNLKFPILSTIKTASLKNLPCGSMIVSPYEQSFVKKAEIKNKTISAYYIDALFDLNLCGEITKHNSLRTLKNFFSKEGSLSDDALKILNQLKKDLDSGNKIAVLSKSNKIPLPTLTDALLSKVSFEYPLVSLDNADIDVIYIHNKADQQDILDIVESRFKTSDFKVYADKKSYDSLSLYSLHKQAGVPVPEETKVLAKQALAFIERAKSLVDELLENLQHNVNEYNMIQGESDLISSSKGQLNESIKRNAQIEQKILENIRDALKLMNKIKDVSVTGEIIDSIAQASKKSSESLETVFDTINVIENDNFFESIAKSTASFEKSTEDLKSVIDRLIEHINSDILGLVVISA